jgi:hypothetical protein
MKNITVSEIIKTIELFGESVDLGVPDFEAMMYKWETSERIRTYDPPPKNKPVSVRQALAVRRLALKGLSGWLDVLQRARWQNYWMDCCRSPKCDYLFSALQCTSEPREKTIDREKDLLNLMDPSQPIWNYLESTETSESIKYRIYLALQFLLRRHAWGTARRILWRNRARFRISDIAPLLLHFIMPRLFGAIIVGFLPFFENSTWEVVLRMQISAPFFILILLTFSFAYFSYDCYSVTEGNARKALKRGALTTLSAYFIACLIACAFVDAMAPVYRPDAESYERINLIFIFAGLTLAFGIIIQMFWEDKTIAEPL